MKRFLKATSAVTAGVLAANARKQDFVDPKPKINSKSEYLDNLFKIPSVEFPKVHAIIQPADKTHRMDCHYRNAMSEFKNRTNFRFPNTQNNANIERFDYDEFIVFYDHFTRNPMMTYEYIDKDSLRGRCNAASRWWTDVRANRYIRTYQGNCTYRLKPLAAKENHPTAPDSNAQTYSMTNAVAMNADLEAGIWRKIENHVRELARQLNHVRGVHVMTGPMYTRQCGKGYLDITATRPVIIPSGFWKYYVVEEELANGQRAYYGFCFMVPNVAQNPNTPIEKYMFPLVTFEQFTRLGLTQNRVIPGQVRTSASIPGFLFALYQ